jgi:site-specific recombinase XerD
MNQAHSSSTLDAVAKSVRRRRRQRRALPVPEPLPDARLACENQATMPKAAARVLGPYANGEKWRLVLLDGTSRKALVADSYEAALKLRDDLLHQLKAHVSRTFGEALADYLADLGKRGIQADTISKIRRMMCQFLPLDEPLTVISTERAEEMYLHETRRIKANGEPLAADSQHLLLRRVKHFYKWAVSRRYVERNPFAEVRPIGRPRRGKLQLRIDEARRFVAFAIERAQLLDVGATAALVQIFLGLRPTEAVIRIVRDLDDAGRVLWVPFGKTTNARRRLQVPEVLREILLKHAAGKPADAPLLGPPGEPMHTRHALRHCMKLLCQASCVPRVCPHSLRGLNATLALEAGATAHHVAAALGHASFTTTARHYADASAVANAGLRKVADVLTGKAQQALDVLQLAGLLREHLSADQLIELRERLAG